MVIGTIVKSNSHISYLCRIYGRLETGDVPEAHQYAFGTFVTLAPGGNGSHLVGVVRDTILLNPDYGNLGPRLSSDDDLAVFSPDYLNEKGVLVDILILGSIEGERAIHGVPLLAAQIGTLVETMPEPDVVSFHRDTRDRFVMAYLPALMAHSDPIVAGLLIGILARLESSFPDQRQVIGVLKNNLAWRARVVPAG